MKNRNSILIIDDDVDRCLLMKVYFLRKNWEVFISHTVYNASSWLKDHQPTIIILASAACQNKDEDIEEIKALAPDAEIIVDGFRIYGNA